MRSRDGSARQQAIVGHPLRRGGLPSTERRSTVRRKHLAISVFAVLTFGALLLPVCDPPPLETGAYLQAVTGHSAVIACATGSPTALGLIVRVADEIVFERPPGVEALRHELIVSGLAPGVAHDFEVLGDGGDVVDRGSFVTRGEDDARRVHFVVAGDTGGQPAWVDMQQSPLFRVTHAHRWLPGASAPRAVADLLLASGADFWLHTGDVVYPAGERRHAATAFFRPFADVLRRMPCYPVLGNHDLMTEAGAPFFENFVLPVAPGDDEGCFTFRDGPVRIVGLHLRDPLGPDDPALAYLRDVAAASSEPWLIVMNHYPVRSVYRAEPREDLAAHYAPLCLELGVDVLLAGHDHNYQRFGEPGAMIEIVTGGGGKSLYDIRHRPPGLAAASVAYHICEFEVEGVELRMTARAVDGRVLDSFTIDKSLLDDAQVTIDSRRAARIRALRQ